MDNRLSAVYTECCCQERLAGDEQFPQPEGCLGMRFSMHPEDRVLIRSPQTLLCGAVLHRSGSGSLEREMFKGGYDLGRGIKSLRDAS